MYISVSLLLCSNALAQQATDTLQTNMHFVIYPHEPTVKQPFRLRSEPSVLPTDTSFPAIRYSLLQKQLETNFETEPIGAAKMKGENLSDLRSGYIKAGGGSNGHSLFEFDMTNKRSRKQALGVSLTHRHANPKLFPDSVLNPVDPKYGFNAAKVYGRRFLRSHVLDAAVTFDYAYHNLYGMGESAPIVPTDAVVDYLSPMMNVGTTMGYQSFFKDSDKVNYDIDLSYRWGQARGNAQEHHIVASGMFSRYYEQELLKAYGEVDTWMSNDTSVAMSAIASLNPHIESRKDRIYARVGLKSSAFIQDANSRIYFYPDVWGEYKVVKDLLIPFFHLGGGMQRNTIASIYQDNPFVGTGQSYLPSNERYFASFGLRGTITSKTSFLVSYKLNKVENQLFYVSAWSSEGVRYFELVPDTMTAKTLTFEASHQQSDRLEVKLGGSWIDYEVFTEQKPWHMPTLKAHASAFYDMQDKIVLDMTLDFVGARWAKTAGYSDEVALSDQVNGVELSPYVDLSLGAEYRYTDRLSAFLQLNNLAGGRYEKWLDYPAEGFHVLGGLNFSF